MSTAKSLGVVLVIALMDAGLEWFAVWDILRNQLKNAQKLELEYFLKPLLIDFFHANSKHPPTPDITYSPQWPGVPI